VKKIKLLSAFRFIVILLAVINIEITAADSVNGIDKILEKGIEIIVNSK
jgi:hypothetical protein